MIESWMKLGISWIHRFEKESKLKRHKIIAEMETVNRQVKFRIIEIAAEQGKESLIPILDEWKETEVKKIRAAIDHAEEQIRNKSMSTI